MRYLTYKEKGHAPRVGVLLDDALHVLDLSDKSCHDIMGTQNLSLLEMVKKGLPSITQKIAGKLETGQYDRDAVVSVRSEEHTSELQSH